MKGPTQTSRNQPDSVESQRCSGLGNGRTTRLTRRFRSFLFLIIPVVTFTSCVGGGAVKGGKAFTTHGPSGTIEQALKQGDSPAQSSRQEQEMIRVRSYTLPSGARLEDALPVMTAPSPFTNHQAIVLSAPMPVTEREETRARTELGAAQKDTTREFGAKLSSLRGITWIGLAMFLVGLFSLVWPPLKVIVGSVTTSAAVLLGGLALMILPTLIVGNELLILGTVLLVVAAWFLAHRHGQLRGLLSGSAPIIPAVNPTATNCDKETTRPN